MSQGSSRPMFIADMMLGKLARWMRILGYDVSYQDPVEDRELLRRARREGRVLLTRDTRLVQRRGVGERLLILNNDPMKQLDEVVRRYPPDPGDVLRRCIRCNAPLVRAEREDVRDAVPDYVFHAETRFGRCPECDRIYWQGTHYRHMVGVCREKIGEVK